MTPSAKEAATLFGDAIPSVKLLRYAFEEIPFI
jgi:hypothetical protein